MVEQLTLNQWVQGSSPCWSTKISPLGLFFLSAGTCKVKFLTLRILRMPNPALRPGRKLSVWAIRHLLASRQAPHTTRPCWSTKISPLGLFFLSAGTCKVKFLTLRILRMPNPALRPGRKLSVWAIRHLLASRQAPHTTRPCWSTKKTSPRGWIFSCSGLHDFMPKFYFINSQPAPLLRLTLIG